MSTAIYYSTHNNMHTNDDITNGSGSTTSGNQVPTHQILTTLMLVQLSTTTVILV